jgi:hypothetical protein
METQTTIPKDWPLKVRLAVRKAPTADRKKLTADLVDMLRRQDPMGLRFRGLDATQRQAVYARQVDAQLRAA